MDRYRSWGEDRVYYYDGSGALRSLPADWTSVVQPEPFVVIAAGRAYFRPADLWALAELIRGMRR